MAFTPLRDWRIQEYLRKNLRKLLMDNANAPLSYQTWRSVNSANRRIIECESQTGVNMELLWGPTQVQTFSAWCLGKNLQENTMQNYTVIFGSSQIVAA